MILIKDKAECSGCSACYSICPQKCINIEKDAEGFSYPVVNTEQCNNCGLCERICPIDKTKSCTLINKDFVREAFVVQHKDNKVLKESTSGGFFTALCSFVLRNDGVVFGAAYDSDLRIKHTWATNEKDLSKFRNSKYTQSEIGDAYKVCKSFLNDKKLVCFSGTPCQIAGLKGYLNKEYSNLITVDFVCRGVPSPDLFNKYITWLGGSDSIDTIRFRDKFYGYFCSTMSIYYKNGKVKRREIHSDPMLSLFFDNYCSRPSCHSCSFKTIERVSDFTMFDCWHANVFNTSFGKSGATALIVQNKRARDLLDSLSEDLKICIQVNIDKLVSMDGVMLTQSVAGNKMRDMFFLDLKEFGFEYVMKKYCKSTFKGDFKNLIKISLMRSRLLSILMHFKYKKWKG